MPAAVCNPIRIDYRRSILPNNPNVDEMSGQLTRPVYDNAHLVRVHALDVAWSDCSYNVIEGRATAGSGRIRICESSGGDHPANQEKRPSRGGRAIHVVTDHSGTGASRPIDDRCTRELVVAARYARWWSGRRGDVERIRYRRDPAG
jgi:hypothetical protein